jgi:hypothetical protein
MGSLQQWLEIVNDERDPLLAKNAGSGFQKAGTPKELTAEGGYPPQQTKIGSAGDPGCPPQQTKIGSAGDPGCATRFYWN